MNNGPQVGDIAPDFMLRRTMDEQVALADVLTRSSALVTFYVFDFGRY